jgi:hypothetical protein
VLVVTADELAALHKSADAGRELVTVMAPKLEIAATAAVTA